MVGGAGLGPGAMMSVAGAGADADRLASSMPAVRRSIVCRFNSIGYPRCQDSWKILGYMKLKIIIYK